MASTPLLIALLAGEHSGDLLGAGLMRALREQHPEVTFIGVGGPLMSAEGLESLVPMEDLAVMGIAEVVKHLPRLLRHRRLIVDTLSGRSGQPRPDVFIGIDAPDFNLPIAKKLKAVGIKTVHYVSPSVWAWRQGRVKGMKTALDHVLCLLPFEQAFYQRHELPATFVGHPLADELPIQTDKSAHRQALKIPLDATLLGILPGSRAGEVERLGPVFLRTAQQLHQQQPQLAFIAPMISAARAEQFTELQQQLAPELAIRIVVGGAREVMAACDALLLTSGTVTLEALLVKQPMVVAYRFSWLSYQLIKRLFKAKFFSLPNLLADEALVAERVQSAANPTQLATDLTHLLVQPQTALLNRYADIHQQLQQDASKRSAEVVLQLALQAH